MQEFLKEHFPLLLPIAYKAFLVIAIWIVSTIISKILTRSLENAVAKLHAFDSTFLPVLKITVKYTVYGIGLLFILNLFGVNTTSLVTLLGAAGITVGLALKNTLSNIAAGLMLLILRPFKNGDSIETGSTSGKVKEINLFGTKIDTSDGLRIYVPNSNLWGSPIKNYSHNRNRRVDIDVGISYNDSIDKAFEILNGIIKEDARFLPEPAPQIMLKSLGDNSVNLQMRAWTKTGEYWNVLWDTNKKIKTSIEEAGLSFPYPQRDIHLFSENEK